MSAWVLLLHSAAYASNFKAGDVLCWDALDAQECLSRLVHPGCSSNACASQQQLAWDVLLQAVLARRVLQ